MYAFWPHQNNNLKRWKQLRWSRIVVSLVNECAVNECASVRPDNAECEFDRGGVRGAAV